jgi:hypothetical protein
VASITHASSCLYYAALRPRRSRRPAPYRLQPPRRQPRNHHRRHRLPRTGTPHEARGLKHRPDGTIAPSPSPELTATPLARRPYDLRHATLSLWLNATSAPAEIAARAGTSTRVPHDACQHCICG